MAGLDIEALYRRYGHSVLPSHAVRLAGLVVVVVATSGASARADVERFAVIAGHNAGAGDEQDLKFAETDAARIAELLGEVGGVPDENQVVLRGKTADQFQRALISMNERIRLGQREGRGAVLFVYYSGHGDADALHLGATRLGLRELEALVRGSSAQIRILVVDSCRSSSLTRVKGGKPAPPLALSSGLDEVPDEGLIVLTASTLGEDAQESDQLAGSFFTHYLASALRGAADDDGDHVVTVGEAFRYARDHTVLASRRTLSGTQHATFHHDLRGRADIPLADLGAARGRGSLTVPGGATWLVVRGSSSGTVVGEIAAEAVRRTLSLRPGKYFVRGRTRDALLEGNVVVVADREVRVDAHRLDRATYAQLVRKGGGKILRSAGGPLAGPVVRTSIIAGASPCFGGMLGWAFVRTAVTVSPRVAACRGGFANRTVEATTDALGLEVRVARAWDVSAFTLDLGITAGGEVLQERFVSRGVASTRTSAAGHVDASAGLSRTIGARTYLATELAAQTHLFSTEDQAGDRRVVARFAVRVLVAVGAWL